MLMNTFSLILFAATVVTGAAWAYDFWVSRPKRRAALAEAVRKNPSLDKAARQKITEQRGVIGQAASLFWVILIVFVLRSFVIEPFRIPSGSMMPTLLSGDFIVVTKWSYGLRNPLTNQVMIETGHPERGDIVVFKYPEDPQTDYIKRVVGLPGDTVIYRDKQVYLLKAGSAADARPELIGRAEAGEFNQEGLGYLETYRVYEEDLMPGGHRMMINPRSAEPRSYYFRQQGAPEGVWQVPENGYFMMGDNRDNSRDSRFWGFVPDEYLVGKTVGIWMSFAFDRQKDDVLPGWVPSELRLGRIGGVR